MISFDAKITEQDLYRFNLRTVYSSSQGIISVVLAIAVLVIAFTKKEDFTGNQFALYVLVAILFAVYIPLDLKVRTKARLKTTASLRNPLHYELGEDGIRVVSEAAEEDALLPWEYVYKIVTTKNALLIYSNRVNAYIIPRSAIDEQYSSIKDYVGTHVEDYKLTLKW